MVWVGEADVYLKGLGQAPVRREFPAVVHRQGVPHLGGYWSEGAAGGTVIMNRASFHRKKQPEELCAKAEVNLLFLPAYSPDFNPIEKDWANSVVPIPCGF
jgi:hypothetical protein